MGVAMGVCCPAPARGHYTEAAALDFPVVVVPRRSYAYEKDFIQLNVALTCLIPPQSTLANEPESPGVQQYNPKRNLLAHSLRQSLRPHSRESKPSAGCEIRHPSISFHLWPRERERRASALGRMLPAVAACYLLSNGIPRVQNSLTPCSTLCAKRRKAADNRPCGTLLGGSEVLVSRGVSSPKRRCY